MDSLFHSLQITTLSTWLSVAGFGVVGASFTPWQVPDEPSRDHGETVIELTPADFLLQMTGPHGGGQAGDAEPAPLPDPADPDPLAAPPELPPLAEPEPLPEIPEIPDLPPPPAPAATRTGPSQASSEAGPSKQPPSGSRSGSAASSRSGSGSSGRTGTGGSGSGSATSRLAAGRMPAPSYPSSSKRKGETGSVTVGFTIGTNGRVIAASVISPSPYPALNEAAVRAVRKWKFPPGGVLKTQRRLDFVLK